MKFVPPFLREKQPDVSAFLADRVFTLKGFGTILTGTLMEGRLNKEQEAMLYPEEIPVKIRSIQVHGTARETAWAGERVAVNIPDKKKEEINRGDVLATKNSLYPTTCWM